MAQLVYLGNCSCMSHAGAGKRPCAVFLDRDGVLNHNVFYPDTLAWEAPRLRSHFVLAEGVPTALARLRDAGFLLFLVSNQPNAVNGKSSLEELSAIHARLTAVLAAHGVVLTHAYYCRHHPAFSGPCACRKPNPCFVLHAAKLWSLDLSASWFIGDRETDLQCGRAAGTRTAWIQTGQIHPHPARSLYDLSAPTLAALAPVVAAIGREEMAVENSRQPAMRR